MVAEDEPLDESEVEEVTTRYGGDGLDRIRDWCTL